MIKFINWILKFVLVSLFLVIITMFGVYFFVDPNQFKEVIVSQVQKQTGHILVLEGPLSWRLSPVLNLELNNISLQDKPPFNNKLLQAKTIQAGISWTSLLSGKFFVNLKLKGLTLVLEKNAKGQGNWESLLNLSQAKNNVNSNEDANTSLNKNKQNITTQNKASDESNTKSIFLSSLTIEDASLSFKDGVKNKQYDIKQLNLSAENLLKGTTGTPSAISLNFVLADPKQKTTAKISLNGNLALKPASDELNITHTSLKVELPDGKTSSLAGEVRVQNLSKNISAVGKLESKNFSLEPWLQIFSVESSSTLLTQADFETHFKYQDNHLNLSSFTLKLANNGSLSGNLELATDKLTPQSLNFKGQFQGQALRFGKILLDEIKGQVAANDGIIRVVPLTVQLANSLQQMSIQIDLRGTTPKYSLTQEGRGFDIKHILAMFDVQNKLEGKTNLKTTLTASGSGLNELKNSISGQTEIEILEGKFYGIDLITVFKEVQSKTYNILSGVFKKEKFNLTTAFDSVQGLLKQKDSLVSTQASTPFNSARANATINGGIINNPNLIISHTEYEVTGHGTVNLASNSVHYQAAALLKKNPYPANDDLGKFLFAAPLPIKVDGLMSKPSIQPDLKTYSNNALNYAKKDAAKQLIEKAVDKNLDKVLGTGLNNLLEQVKGK